ncbi:hypothetical protein C8R44DRAFT_860439 [Mycena epipterygia]|nr:hypothetical protein C8R44DRAFT_860439 [Mycena epipterygia]
MFQGVVYDAHAIRIPWCSRDFKLMIARCADVNPQARPSSGGEITPDQSCILQPDRNKEELRSGRKMSELCKRNVSRSLVTVQVRNTNPAMQPRHQQTCRQADVPRVSFASASPGRFLELPTTCRGMETQTHGAAYPQHSSLLPDSTTKSEIRALLRSHSLPPDNLPSTISALSEELVRYDARALFYEYEILRLRAQLARAKTDRAELQTHYEELRSLLSPIRRLPSEVLVHIFALCAKDPLADQFAQLARKSLLTVSQVCVRWHGIALGTPTLWDTIELDSINLWRTPRRVKRVLRLLRLALERAAKAPLHVSMCLVEGMDSIDALKLLAEHCEQWKTVAFFCRSSDLQYLSGIKGKLPLLETLEVEVHDTLCPVMDFFDVAPRLRTFIVGGLLLPTVGEVHLGQLHTFGCLGQDPKQVSTAVSFMPRIPHAVTFRLQLFLSNWAYDNIVGINLQPTSSNISSLSVDTRDYFDATHCVKALSDIFTSLTLPHLHRLDFRSSLSPLSLIYWPHSAFIDLAARSAFYTHLESLSLCDVVVTEPELIETLVALPSLRRLAISDHQLVKNCGAHQLLITDSLFSALTLKPDSPHLAPRLHFLTCQSLLQFDDRAYLSFLLSRRRPTESEPFLSRMYWLEGHYRDLDASVFAHLRELRIQNELLCEFSRAELWLG